MRPSDQAGACWAVCMYLSCVIQLKDRGAKHALYVHVLKAVLRNTEGTNTID